MVDINLFKEDEGEEKEWNSNSDEGEELEDALQDEDLGLSDQDISEPSALDDDLLSEDDEVIPDFGESVNEDQEEDYEFGEVKQRKTSPFVFVALGVVVIAAAVYLFVIQPKERAAQQAVTPRVRRPASMQTATQQAGSDAEAPGSAVPDTATRRSTPSVRVAESVDSGRREGAAPVIGSMTSFVRASKTVVDEFSKHSQFAAFIMSGNQFHVGYVSETPNVAQAMRHKVETLLGASDLKTSPEERHRTAGKIYYWGVVSGQLNGPPQANASEAKRFTTADGFVDGMKGVVQQNRLTTREVQKLFEGTYAGKRQAQVRMKIEGSKTNAMDFLNGLQNFQGNYGLTKLIIAPVTISDFEANQVKLVLDFLVSFG